MDDPSPRAALGRWLGHAARQWRRAIDEKLEPFGLTEATLWPLLHAARGREPMRQNKLAAKLGIEGSTLVRLIDVLDRAGLIERKTCDDRRAWALHVTPRGRALAEQVEAVANSIRQEVLGSISDEELATTLSVLERICAETGRKPLPGSGAVPLTAIRRTHSRPSRKAADRGHRCDRT
jgi:MarR family transcriptional regulator for hemolysin